MSASFFKNCINWAVHTCIITVTCALIISPAAAASEFYPTGNFEKIAPDQLGWDLARLDQAKLLFESFPAATFLVVHRGKPVVSWGPDDKRVKVSSVRKSLLSALFGVYSAVDSKMLDTSLKDLKVDDTPPLNETEKQATPRMLLKSRSGIYHSFVAGTPAMLAGMPERNSYAPGAFWYYNNWDFNALGSIFEKQYNVKIAQAFLEKIASPLGMQDYRTDDMYYLRAAENSNSQSDHAAYHFRLTARDMARFGLLYLRGGNWNGQQIIPEEWIRESTSSYSQTKNGGGYGYLWWVNNIDGVSEHHYSAVGALSKYILVFPSRDLVIVYQNHKELPDDAQSMTPQEVDGLPSIKSSQLAQLINLVLSSGR